jgi:hypothetical protein
MTTNVTPADDLGELDRLLVNAMIDGLKQDAPKASFLAVVERYLSSRKASLPPAPAPLAEAAALRGIPALPFPAQGAPKPTSGPTKQLADDEGRFADPEFTPPKL